MDTPDPDDAPEAPPAPTEDPARLTPLALQQQTFSTSFRGLDAAEVTDFIETIRRELELLLRERHTLQGEVARLRGDNAQLQQEARDAAAQRDAGIQAAEQRAAEAIAQAAADAEAPRAAAQTDAEALHVAAQTDADQLRAAAQAAAELLRAQAQADADQLRAQAQAHVDQLRAEANHLAQQREQLLTSLRDVLTAQTQLLDSFAPTPALQDAPAAASPKPSRPPVFPRIPPREDRG